MAYTTYELMWIYSLEEMSVFCNKPIMTHCEYQASMCIANNPVFSRAKHKKVDCHFIGHMVIHLIVTSFDVLLSPE